MSPSPARVELRGLGWDHPRCVRPMAACARAWSSLHPHVRVTWDVRSLLALGDQPLEEIAAAYDLVLIDHPFCGAAEAAGLLRPFDELLDAVTLAALAADAVGPSHASYTVDGRQWALAADGASHASALHPELQARAPATWEDALALASELAPRVAVPLAPAHAVSAFLTLCANGGSPAAGDPAQLVAPAVGAWALEILRELYARGPAEATRWEPPDALARLAGERQEIAYVPLTYAYVTYASDDAVPRPCRFVDIPSAGAGPVGAILGGVGLAIPAASPHAAEAAAFAAWVCSPEVQRTIVGRNGGQPGSRSAWLDGTLDRAAHGFYGNTLATLEAAWVRPRAPWWPPFQLQAGRIVAAALESGAPSSATLAQLDALYLGLRGSAGVSG